MKRRADNASLFDESFGSTEQGYSSNMKLMMIVAAFLVVTIGLLLVKPSVAPNDVAATEPGSELSEKTQTAATISSKPIFGTLTDPAYASDVTRSETSLLSLGGEAHIQDVSKMLRQPIRLDGHYNDLRDLSRKALAQFGYDAPLGDKLHALLVQSLTERQSNSYIDALLNASASRGDIGVPVGLQMPSGRLDTRALLEALLMQAGQ